MAEQPPLVGLERSKSVPIDAPYGLGNLLLPVMLFYHPSMKSLAENIVLQVQKRKMEDEHISVCVVTSVLSMTLLYM